MNSWQRFPSDNSVMADPALSHSSTTSYFGAGSVAATNFVTPHLFESCIDSADRLHEPMQLKLGYRVHKAVEILSRNDSNAWVVLGERFADTSLLDTIVIDCSVQVMGVSETKTEPITSKISRFLRLKDLARTGAGYYTHLSDDFFLPTGASIRSSSSEIALADSVTSSRAYAVVERNSEARVPFWVSKVSSLDSAKQFHKALMEVTRQTELVRREGNQKKFMDQLTSLELSEFSEFVLVGLLRNTFAFRTTLPLWSDFRDRVAAELENRDLKVEVSVLLRGMLDAARDE